MGSKAPSTTIVQPPMPQVQERPLQPIPAQTVQETSRQLAESQLEFNPRLAQQAFELQQRFLPQTAELQFGVQRNLVPQAAQLEFETAQKFTPLYRAIYEQAFPEQAAGLRTLAAQSQQRFESPEALTPQQQALQDAYRQRAREQIQRNVRQSAELGGTLFGGRRIEAESEALNRFEQGLLESDIARQVQARDQALRELIASQQVIFPQIQQPGVPQGGVPGFQGVTPSADALLQAIIAQSQGAIINPAIVGFGPSARSQNAALLSGAGSLIGGFRR